MSGSLRLAFRALSQPLRGDFLNSAPRFSVQASRFLYAKETLGIDSFNATRKYIKHQMVNIGDKFRERMSGYTAEDSSGMIFTEDLKNMMHLAESEADLDLVVKMTKKFNSQNKQLRFGSFVFGPVMMRMFHIHNKVDLALECFKSPELDGLFDQITTYQILLDLCYENQKYQEMLDVFAIIKNKQLEGAKYPRNVVVLLMAACYKLNSKESAEYAVKLWNDLLAAGHFPMRRATTFCAGLTLNQGKPDIAMEMLSAVRNPSYVTIRNIKVKALTELGRLDEAILILKSIISADQPGEVTQTFSRDALDSLKEAVLKADNPETSLEFNRLENLFEKEGHISEETLDAQLCSEIQRPPMMNNRQVNRFSRYQPDHRDESKYRNTDYRNTDRRNTDYRNTDRWNTDRRKTDRTFRRPGLNDLV